MSVVAASEVRPFSGTVAKKILISLTGVVLFGFVIVHMIGNLQLYAGPEKLNRYAAFLQGLGPVLWLFRAVLLAAVGVHALFAVLLWLRNRAARPQPYAYQDFQEATLPSRTMIVSGPLIGLFIVYHLLHFTVGVAHPEFTHGDVYRNVILGFQNVPASVCYIVAMVALGFHLFHGLFSVLQTLGLRTPAYDRPLKALLLALTAAVVVVNISFPVAVLAGVVKLPPAAPDSAVAAAPADPATPAAGLAPAGK